mmetsp:Transcript_33971/g.36672  ORF Transcript_33971/g.36672 Transcript_33971/m.36672 type:complete len:812 (+) Transcript_33971:118-2553(+)
MSGSYIGNPSDSDGVNLANVVTAVEDYTIVANVNYVASTYVAPPVFKFVGSVLERIVVGSEKAVSGDQPNSILAFVSGNRAEQVEYIKGLVGIGIFLCCMVSIWFIAILIVKCQGRDRMGCAAGYAFHDETDDSNDSYYGNNNNRTADDDSDGVAAILGGDDDDHHSITRDCESKSSSKRTTMSRLSSQRLKSIASSTNSKMALSTARLSSAFGSHSNKEKTKLQQLRATTPAQADAESPPRRRWSAVVHHEEPTYSHNYGHGSNSNSTIGMNRDFVEEIELHMELDDIVKSTNQKKRNDTRTTLRSLPPKQQSTDKTSPQKHLRVWGQSCCCSHQHHYVMKRKISTRIVFALTAILSLLCCVLLMTHMYIPLESAAQTTQSVIEETANVVDEMNEVLTILDTTASVAISIMDTTPTNYATLCPLFPLETFVSSFGFNPNDMIATVQSEYQSYIPQVIDLLTTAKETSSTVTNVLQDVNQAVASTNDYLWIIPLIICSTILIIFSQLTLLSAVIYGEISSKDENKKSLKMETPAIENCYGYTILPLQTIVVLFSWILVILFCFGIIVTTDSCTPSIENLSHTGNNNMNKNNFELFNISSTRDKFDIAFDEITSGRGTPDDTVLAVLDQYIGSDSDSGTDGDGSIGDGSITDTVNGMIDELAYQRLSTYVTGCGGRRRDGASDTEDPLAEVIVIQLLLQESLDSVGKQISFANDVLGLDLIQTMCGGDSVELFFNNLLQLNTQFQNVNKAIKQAYDALSCPRINTLYVDAVHNALCTDFATANTNGLLLLIVISFCGMILITLRASWRSSST